MTTETDKAAETSSAAATDILLGLAFAALAAGALLWLIPNFVSHTAATSDIAPSFFPNLAASVILVLSLGMVAHRVTRTQPAPISSALRVFGEAACLSAAAALLVYALSTIGFLPSAVGLILAGGLLARYERWWALGLLAIVFPVLVDIAAWRIFVVDLP